MDASIIGLRSAITLVGFVLPSDDVWTMRLVSRTWKMAASDDQLWIYLLRRCLKARYRCESSQSQFSMSSPHKDLLLDQLKRLFTNGNPPDAKPNNTKILKSSPIVPISGKCLTVGVLTGISWVSGGK